MEDRMLQRVITPKWILVLLVYTMVLVYIVLTLFDRPRNVQTMSVHLEGQGYDHDSLEPTEHIGGVSGKLFSGDVVRGLPTLPSLAGTTFVGKSRDPTCTHWATVTTVHWPADAMKHIVADGQWCVVIAGDKKTPATTDYLKALGKSKKTIKFLEPDDQDALYPAMSKSIPWNSFARKNIAYLYAIQHGAKVIWDFDDDNDGVVDIKHYLSGNVDALSACPGFNKNLFNPYPMFGVNETYTWARGFPLQDIRNKDTVPKLCQFTGKTNFGVVQSLANNQPDVDAIYRLTRDAPFNFKATPAKNKPIIVPKGSFTPFNAQATLWTKDAFPYLALPISVHGRVSDIWRGYFAELFLHKLDLQLVFSPPYVTQYRNDHTIIGDFDGENHLYIQSKQLVDFLSDSLGGSKHKTLELLYNDLYTRQFIEKADLLFIQMWFRTLEAFKE